MKKMSCFCASNSSGESVYSGYLRWRMGLPLPPIPKEDSKLLCNMNTMILQDIDGVKNVNDLTVDESDTEDETPRRFRRRKRVESTKTDQDSAGLSSSITSPGTKHFRENPLYRATEYVLDEAPLQKSQDEPFVSSRFETGSYSTPYNPPSTMDKLAFIFPSPPQQLPSSALTSCFQPPEESVSSFLVNKFLTTVHEFSENDVDMEDATATVEDDEQSVYPPRSPQSLVQALGNVVGGLRAPMSMRAHSVPAPAIPPHRKPSTIIEEDSCDGSVCSTLVDDEQEQDEDDDNKENEDTTLPSTLNSRASDGGGIMTCSIPIFSIKHGDIDRILGENIPAAAASSPLSSPVKPPQPPGAVQQPQEYDYAYNKSWSQGVQLNLSLNLLEDKRRQAAAAEAAAAVTCGDNGDSTEPLTVLLPGDATEDDSTAEEDLVCLPDTSPLPTPFAVLKLSSIEADALSMTSVGSVPPAAANCPGTDSPVHVSRDGSCQLSLAESTETTDSISRSSETWDLIHGQFVKEITGTRFIDPSILNNNKPGPLGSLAHPHSTDEGRAVPHSANKRSYCPPEPRRHSHSSSTTPTGGAALSPVPVTSPTDGRRFFININPNIPLDKQPWYHFYLTRSRAEALLHTNPDGSFLVRRSESNKNDYSLSIKHHSQFLHMKITKNQLGFVLGQYSQPYQSIPQMLYHYCLTMVPVKGADSACLRYAVTRDSVRAPPRGN